MSQVEQPELVPVTSVDAMVGLLAAWNHKQLKLLNHMKEVPEGSDVEIGEETVKLEGDVLKAYKLGLSIGEELLGKLPFQIIPETEDESSGT